MHGETTVDVLAGDGVQGVGGAVDLPALAPRVIGQSLDHGSCVVGDGHDGAQLVVVQVAAGVGGCACGQLWAGYRATSRFDAHGVHGESDAAGLQVVFVFCYSRAFEFFLIGQA